MKHITDYVKQDGTHVQKHIRNGMQVEHETHGKGQVLHAEYESGAKFLWFYNQSKGLIKVGKVALKG
jgi:hypothetical protein